MADTHQQRAGNSRLGRRLRRGRQDRRVRGEPQQRRIAGRTEDRRQLYRQQDVCAPEHLDLGSAGILEGRGYPRRLLHVLSLHHDHSECRGTAMEREDQPKRSVGLQGQRTAHRQDAGRSSERERREHQRAARHGAGRHHPGGGQRILHGLAGERPGQREDQQREDARHGQSRHRHRDGHRGQGLCHADEGRQCVQGDRGAAAVGQGPLDHGDGGRHGLQPAERPTAHGL